MSVCRPSTVDWHKSAVSTNNLSDTEEEETESLKLVQKMSREAMLEDERQELSQLAMLEAILDLLLFQPAETSVYESFRSLRFSV